MSEDDRSHATRNFGMVWQNDYDVYHLVLGYARALLRDHPNMSDATLGRNVKDYVFALRNGGGWGHPDGMGSPRVRDALQWIDADSHPLVDEADVAEDVRYGLGSDEGDGTPRRATPPTEGRRLVDRPTRTPEEKARVQAMVDRLVADAPPLTPEQAARLAALLPRPKREGGK